jgi:hypothetical protein
MVWKGVELSASVGGFSVDFGGQCCLSSDDQSIQERGRTAWLYLHCELDMKSEASGVSKELL